MRFQQDNGSGCNLLTHGKMVKYRKFEASQDMSEHILLCIFHYCKRPTKTKSTKNERKIHLKAKEKDGESE